MEENNINTPLPQEETEAASERGFLGRQYDRFETSLHLTPKKMLNVIYFFTLLVLIVCLITIYSVVKIWL